MDFNLMHPAEQIVMLLNRIYAKQFTTTSGGNLSIKDSEGNIWITPSGIDKGALTEQDICKILPDGTVIGKHKPSVELPFHKLVYKVRPDVGAVLHAHPPALVSYSLTRQVPDTNIIPAPFEICGPVGLADYEVPGSIELGENIANEFKKNYNVVIMDNHGVVTCADNLFEAFKRFETLEFAARLNILSSSLGKAVSLTDEQLENMYCGKNGLLDEFIPRDYTSNERKMRKEMCTLIHRAYDQNLFTSTQGVFSVRLSKDSFLITPNGLDRKYLEPSDLVRIDKGWREAGKKPSRSVELHQIIYDNHPEINAITSATPANLMAFGITRAPLDSRTIPESYIMMRDIVRVPFGTPFSDPKSISDKMGERTPVVLVENDCIITTGNTLIKAFDRLEVAEFTAKTVIDAQKVGKIQSISDEEIETINKAFNLK